MRKTIGNSRSFSQIGARVLNTKGSSLNKKYVVVFFLFLLLFFLLVFFFLKPVFLGFTFLELNNIVSFTLDPNWNLSEGFVRINQNISSYESYNLSSYVTDNTLSLDLDSYALENGYVFVELWINGIIVANESVFYQKQSPSQFSFFDQISLAIQSNTEESAGIESTDSGFFLANSTGTYQVDHVLLEPLKPFINDTLLCSNGSLSSDVTQLLYIWYVNGSSLRLDNRSSLGVGNASVHDRVDCAIIPQQGNSLVAYWPFDEGSGTEFHEFVNNYSGSSNYSNWTLGRNDYAITPNATNNLTVGNTAGLNLTGNFSLELWIYSRDTTPQELYNLDGFRIFLQSGTIRVHFPLGHNVSSQRLVSKGVLPLNTWNQIAVTYDNTTLSLYLNGALDNTTALSGRLGNYSGVLYFGTDPIAANGLKGFIDEIALYRMSLTALEVYDHYRYGVSRTSKHNTLLISTTQAEFGNGTCANVNCITQPGNITLAVGLATPYSATGNFTSPIFELPNGYDDPILRWNNFTPLGTNISLQIRTGIAGDNESIFGGNFSGPDYTHSKDRNLLVAFDFSEGEGNISISKGYFPYQANFSDVDFTAKGKHGFGARFYGINGMTVGYSPILTLANTRNYSLEIWVEPIDRISNVPILFKNQYFLYTNSSGNVIFNASYSSITYSLPSVSPLPIDQWTHIAITHDFDNITRLYINGTLESSLAMNGTIDSAINSLSIGDGTGFTAFNGTLDSFALYNKTLSTTEVLAHGQDVFTNSSGGEFTGELNRFVQYRVFFVTNDSTKTPTLYDVSLRVFNYSTFIYNHVPENLSLTSPTNNTLVSSVNITLNWNTPRDLENNTRFYEFMLSNDSNFSTILISTLAVNNFSRLEYSDDNHTSLIFHFDTKENFQNKGVTGTFLSYRTIGKFGRGFAFSGGGQYFRFGSTPLNTDQGTIEFWVQPYWNANDSQVNYFLDQTADKVAMNRSGSLLTVSLDALNASTLTYNISSWSAYEWHHLAVSWKRNGNMTLFVDGARVNRTLSPPLVTGYGEGFFYIGSTAGSSGIFPLNGTVDEFRISRVAREALVDLNTTNYTITTADYADNTYYWRVRAIQNFNLTLEGEKEQGPWSSEAIRLDTRTPTLTIDSSPIAVPSSTFFPINISSSEPTYCEFKNHDGSYGPVNFTFGLKHSVSFNISLLRGNYTYYFNCNDTVNTFVNTTMSFYIFNRTLKNPTQNISTYSYLANISASIDLITSAGENITTVSFTPRNTLNAKIFVIKYPGDFNPEPPTAGLESYIVAFWTVIPDDFLVSNLSTNASVTLFYSEGDISGNLATKFRLYYYDYHKNEWMPKSETTPKGEMKITFSTKDFGTYTLSGTKPPKKASGTAAAESSIWQTGPYIPFHDEEIVNYTTYEYPYARLYSGEEQTIELDDSTLALFTVYFASNTYLEDVIVSITGQDAGEAYGSFSITSESMESTSLEYLTLEYTVDKAWLEENGYTIDDIVFYDNDGNEYTVTSVSEDEYYYYLQSTVSGFGTFTIDVTMNEETTTTSEENVSSATNESTTDLTPQQSSVFSNDTLGAFFTTLLLFLAIIFVSHAGLAFILTLQKRYPFTEKDILEKGKDLGELKKHIFKNRSKEDLEQDLLDQGWSKRDYHTLLQAMKNLPQGKLENYIYQRLCMGHDEEEIFQDLKNVGWKENQIRKEITRFQNI
ncbi:PGF-pre-PGF domain-containing protein [Candidatus Woesearchaeota archaeon]|nr:PGF-pre-PGF domain-containing protein [Candidatus Woesearchaeota archaeon]